MLVQDSEIVRKGQGKNIIPPPERPSLLLGFIKKFNDPLIIILLVVFFFSICVSFYEYQHGASWNIFLEPTGVLIALLLATGVGFIFEVKAENEFEVLNQVKDDELVKVVRNVNPNLNLNANPISNTIVLSIPKKDVCVGDLVRLEAGDEVPADGHIQKSNKLLVDESAFTGEPFAEKNDNLNPNENLNLNEGAYPADFLLRGSIVMEGSAEYEVSAIGMETEEGKGSARVQEGKEVKTPLNRQLDVLGKWISTASFVIGALIVIGRMVFFYFKVEDPTQLEIIHFVLGSIMIAVTLIVVAVPEGLPMSITVSLAMSMRKMLKENNLVRKLHACETMGAATIICTDKTGTLTQNRMTVVESLTDQPLTADSLLALGIAVNSTAELNDDQVIGNPTEGALLLWLRSQGIDYKALRSSVSVVEQQPFSSQTKFMQTTARLSDGRIVTFLKGAPEIIAQKCEQLPADFQSKLEEYQAKAYRTLAFCWQDVSNNLSFTISNLPFQGLALVGIADPIREDVPAAIDLCKNGAHVKVMIVTGDTTGTANEIGRQIGLLADGENDKTITGPDFAALEDKVAKEMLREGKIKIIARARPDDKARLVVLLQRNGEVVAVTGDGTNDAPALSKAQVGLSMGDGTARAKEASDITIIDNSFASINKAILWGRSLYQNIRRFIIFQLTVNVCACLIVLLGAFTGLDSPLNVTQMLWVNLIMDTFAAMALSSLPADPKVMYDYPRSPRAHIIDRAMLIRIVGWGTLFFALLAAYWLRLEFGESDHELERYDLSKFFTFFIFLQFWNLFNTRYFKTDRSLFFDIRDAIKGVRPLSETFSKSFIFIAVVILVGQVLIVQFAGEMFEVCPLSVEDWLQLFFGTSLVLIVHDIWHSMKVNSEKRKVKN